MKFKQQEFDTIYYIECKTDTETYFAAAVGNKGPKRFKTSEKAQKYADKHLTVQASVVRVTLSREVYTEPKITSKEDGVYCLKDMIKIIENTTNDVVFHDFKYMSCGVEFNKVCHVPIGQLKPKQKAGDWHHDIEVSFTYRITAEDEE